MPTPMHARPDGDCWNVPTQLTVNLGNMLIPSFFNPFEQRSKVPVKNPTLQYVQSFLLPSTGNTAKRS